MFYGDEFQEIMGTGEFQTMDGGRTLDVVYGAKKAPRPSHSAPGPIGRDILRTSDNAFMYGCCYLNEDGNRIELSDGGTIPGWQGTDHFIGPDNALYSVFLDGQPTTTRRGVPIQRRSLVEDRDGLASVDLYEVVTTTYNQPLGTRTPDPPVRYRRSPSYSAIAYQAILDHSRFLIYGKADSAGRKLVRYGDKADHANEDNGYWPGEVWIEDDVSDWDWEYLSSGIPTGSNPNNLSPASWRGVAAAWSRDWTLNHHRRLFARTHAESLGWPDLKAEELFIEGDVGVTIPDISKPEIRIAFSNWKGEQFEVGPWVQEHPPFMGRPSIAPDFYERSLGADTSAGCPLVCGDFIREFPDGPVMNVRIQDGKFSHTINNPAQPANGPGTGTPDTVWKEGNIKGQFYGRFHEEIGGIFKFVLQWCNQSRGGQCVNLDESALQGAFGAKR